MSVYNFGVGNMYARRTDISNPTPVLFGTLQDVDISVDRTLKELIGQYQMPVDIAQAQMKIMGKSKFARISANALNDLMLGQSLTPTSGEQVAVNEAQSVPGSSTYTITSTQHSTFLKDLGVFYSATGIQLTRVAPASEATGKYSVDEATGIYTFAAGDASAAVLLNYSYSVSTMVKIVGANQLMGTGPSFELHLQSKYTSNTGVVNTMNLKLHACKGSKLSFPFKNVDYTIPDFDFQAFADAAGNWGTFSFIE